MQQRMNTRRPYCFVLQALLALMLLTASGCGKAEYERRVLAGRGGKRVAVALSAPVNIPGTPLQIALPTSIDQNAKAYTEASPEPNGQGAKVKPERLNPPFLPIPGLRVCYEVQLEDQASGKRLPIFWYLGASPVQDPLPDGKPIEKYAKDKLTTEFAVQKVKPVEDTVGSGAPGSPPKWKRVTLEGNQPFIDLSGSSIGVDAMFQMLIGEVEGWRVVVAFRAPKSVIAQVNPEEAAPKVVDSITSTVPAAAPAPPAE